jgi:hypothetical protein
MAWLTWRQHRIEALASALVLALLSTVFITAGLHMHDVFHRDGIGACVSGASKSSSCGYLASSFNNRFPGPIGTLAAWLNLVPLLVGVFVGAPLLAREFEQGTWQLAWTQAVPRIRWLGTKLPLLLLGTILVSAAVAGLYTWYQHPLDSFSSRLDGNSFDLGLVALPAYAVFALALGVLAGVVLRRTVLAMVATLAGFAAVRFPVESWLRQHYQHPLTAIDDPFGRKVGAAHAGDWVLHSEFVDRAGHALSTAQAKALANAGASAGGGNVKIHVGFGQYLQSRGYRLETVYQPASRFWHFQVVEASLFLALALIAIAIALWQLRRRVG